MPAQPCIIIYDAANYDFDENVGYFAFDDMRGDLQPRAEQLEAFTRPGHDGHHILKLGVQAEPSTIVTVRGVADREDAKQFLVDYNSLRDGNPYEVVQHGQSFGFFHVLRVRQVGELQAITSSIGMVGGACTIIQRVQWELLSVPEPVEEP